MTNDDNYDDIMDYCRAFNLQYLHWKFRIFRLSASNTCPIFFMSISAVASPEVKPDGVSEPASMDEAISVMNMQISVTIIVNSKKSANA